MEILYLILQFSWCRTCKMSSHNVKTLPSLWNQFNKIFILCLCCNLFHWIHLGFPQTQDENIGQQDSKLSKILLQNCPKWQRQNSNSFLQFSNSVSTLLSCPSCIKCTIRTDTSKDIFFSILHVMLSSTYCGMHNMLMSNVSCIWLCSRLTVGYLMIISW